MKLKVLTYNIHGARGFISKRDRLNDLQELIEEENADIICVQELWKDQKTKNEQLKEALKENWPFFSYGENAFFPTYNLGNGIFSRFKIKEHKNIKLNTQSKEPRSLLWCKIIIAKNKEIDVLCTHLSVNSVERSREIKLVTEIVQKLCKGPFILAGDFNDWNNNCSNYLMEHLSLQEVGLSTRKRHFKTFPTIFPVFALDRIYFSGVKLLNASVCTKRYGPSDHRSVSSEFIFTKIY